MSAGDHAREERAVSAEHDEPLPGVSMCWRADNVREAEDEGLSEVALDRRADRRLGGELHGAIIGNGETGPGVFRERQLRIWRASDWLKLRVGGLYDRITITQTGTTPAVAIKTYGSRKESRAYVGLIARFGRVNLQGVEGIELDHEPYQVSFHHDKGFLQLQTTF